MSLSVYFVEQGANAPRAPVHKARPLWPWTGSLQLSGWLWSTLSHMKLAVPRLQLSFSWCTVILPSVFNVLV